MAELTRTPARTVTHNVLAMLIARVATALAGVVSLPVVYAHLGAQDFGIWVLLSGLGTMVALADLGLGSAIVREVAASIHDGAVRRSRIALGMGLVWGIVLSVGGAAVLLIVWPWLSHLLRLGAASGAARWATLIILLAILVDGISMPWRGVLEGTQRYVGLAWISGGTAVLGAGFTVLAVHLGGGIVELAMSAAAAAAIRAALIVALARHRVADLSPTLAGITRAEIRSVGSYSLRVQVTSASGAVNVELDRFIITGFFSPAAAGGFDLGSRVVGLFRLVPVFALVAMFPMAVTKHAEHGTAWLDRFNLVATKYFSAFAAIGAAALVVCADPLIRLWLGQSNSWAAAGIAVLAPAYALNLIAGTTGTLSRIEGRPGRETAYAVISVVVNLALTWPLLRAFGPVGVPLATAIGIAVGTFYFLISYHRATNRRIIPLARVIWPSVAAAAAAALIAALLQSRLPDGSGRLDAGLAVLCRGSIVVLVAGVVLVLTGFFRGEATTALRRMVQRGSLTGPSATGGAG